MNNVTGNKFLLIDDHQVVRKGIKTLISENYQPKVIHEASDEESSLKLLKRNKYDLILMDIQMPNTDTLGLMEYINTEFPGTKVLIFSMNSENIYAKRFLKAGAKGFVSKDVAMDEIIKAINLALSNKRYISDNLLEILTSETGPNGTANPFQKLSVREFEIVRLLLAGETVNAICKLLNLQPSTVSTYKTRLLKKLSITNLLELKELYESFHK